MSELHETSVTAGHGLWLDEVVVTHRAWADDTWVFDASQQGLHAMLTELSPHAWKTTGLAIRWTKCAYAQATGDPREPPTTESAPMRADMRQHGQGECFKVVGSHVLVGPQRSEERAAIKQKCWAAYHMRRNFWRTRGSRCAEATNVALRDGRRKARTYRRIFDAPPGGATA